MKNLITKPSLLLVAFIVILITNAIAWGAAYYNRSGTSEATMVLSERELRPVIRDENSGVSLRLLVNSEQPQWLDAGKLRELGFPEMPEKYSEEDWHYRFDAPRSRPVFLVLEYEGTAYEKRLKTLKDKLEKPSDNKEEKESSSSCIDRAQRQLEDAQNCESRLYAIDAGPNEEALRRRYPDTRRYLIVHGSVTPWYDHSRDEKTYFLMGRINGVSISTINVPRQWNGLFTQTESSYRSPYRYGYSDACREGKERLRYQVTVNYGKRLEPWVDSCSISASPSSPLAN